MRLNAFGYDGEVGDVEEPREDDDACLENVPAVSRQNASNQQTNALQKLDDVSCGGLRQVLGCNLI